MSTSRHPVALSLERLVGGRARLLATVMALPLVDGIFPALVIAGAVSSLTGVLETGLLIFGGSATVAVILAELDGDRWDHARAILLLGAVLIPVAAVEAALAPTFENLLNTNVFHRFAGLVILAVAAKTASARVGEWLPRPAVVVGLGLVASVRPEKLRPGAVEMTADPVVIGYGAAAAGVGVAFALLVALAGPKLRGAVDIDRFRFGSAVALGMLALSVLELMPTTAPVALGVLAVTVLFSYDPDAPTYDRRPAAVADGGDGAASDRTAADSDGDGDGPPPEQSPANGDPGLAAADVDVNDNGGDRRDRELSNSDSRAPWL
jgi:hypothetical protein